jgi:PIN domain nuclease of toxin-antitoxin system
MSGNGSGSGLTWRRIIIRISLPKYQSRWQRESLPAADCDLYDITTSIYQGAKHLVESTRSPVGRLASKNSAVAYGNRCTCCSKGF